MSERDLTPAEARYVALVLTRAPNAEIRAAFDRVMVEARVSFLRVSPYAVLSIAVP